jgi:diguanylate cyclase (GGDEF)-like protein
MFRSIIRHHGITWVASGITLIAIALALGITWGVHMLLKGHGLKEDLLIAVLAALVIVPIFSVPILRLLRQLDEAEKHLQTLSFTDDLTQIYNRRYFMQYLDQEFKRAQRTGDVFSIAILDLDNFKHINDQWGHLVGDQVLQAMTRKFEGTMRQADICARYGGDEFIFLFPHTNRVQVQIWADRIYEIFAETPIRLDGVEISPSFSVGVASFERIVATLGDLFKQADDSLYQAKHNGGNQYVHSRD